MPITGATRDAVEEILKDDYLGPIRDQLNSATLLSQRLEKDEENVDGRVAKIPIRIGRNRGIQAVLEAGILPNPGSQKYQIVEVGMAYNYALVQVTGPAMAASRTDLGAFIRILDQEVRGAVEDLKVDLNRQRWGDGSGRLGIVSALPGGAVITVKGVWDTNDKQRTLRFIEVGDRLAAWDISAGAPIPLTASLAYSVVTAVNLQAKTITMDANIAGALAAGDELFKGPDVIPVATGVDGTFRIQNGTNPHNDPIKGSKREIMGMVGIVNGPNGWPTRSVGAHEYVYGAAATLGDTYVGTAAGVTLTAAFQNLFDTRWQANMMFNAGVLRPLDTDLLQQGFDLSEELGQVTPTIGITSYGVRRRYVDLLVPDRRYTGENTYKLDGGWSAIDYNGVPVVVDKDAPECAFFWLSEPNLADYRMSDYYWLDKDGNILKWVDRRDAWEAALAIYMEQGTDRRNAHTAIGNIAI
jgi:hypothetical protein